MYAIIGVGFVIAVLLCIRYYFKRKTAEPVRPYNCLTIRMRDVEMAAEMDAKTKAANRTSGR